MADERHHQRTVSIKDVQVTVDAEADVRSVIKHPLSNGDKHVSFTLETFGDELHERENERFAKDNEGFDGEEEGSSDKKEKEPRGRIDTVVIDNRGFELNDNDRERNEELLMKLLSKRNSFDAIKKKITPKALTKCSSNSLLMGMKVNYRLRSLAKSKGSEGEMFNKFANSVEGFTTHLLDPMQSNQNQRFGFGNFILDDILDDAIDLEQKKFFTHPVVHSEMTRKWRGRLLMTINTGKWTWFFLHIWCLFEMVLAPITFHCVSYLTDTSVIGAKLYLEYLKTPYFIFVRDTLSYLALVGLHYAFCLSPSSLEFSGLEWSILIFFVGRSLVEYGQVMLIVERIEKRRKTEMDETNSNVLRTALSRYISDRWNKLDVISVLTYLVILVLRLTTWITSESVTNNRAVLVAGYLYSFNTLFLTLRIGHVVETFKDPGTIQIALFNVLQDVFTIMWQFLAALLAFSVALTKIFLAEKTFHPSGGSQQNLACTTSGVSCWWKILTHLSWSLLEIEQGFNPLNSVDTPSVVLAKTFYAVFLFIAVILLVNMLIALLSHTYQQVKDNALKEWSYKKAVTIQTYESYNPIHAPLNIISEFLLLHWWNKKKERTGKTKARRGHVEKSKKLFQHLEAKYFAKHGNLFPVTDEKKLDEVYLETEKNRQMLTQILLRTVNNQNFDLRSREISPQEWDIETGINVNDNVLTCEGVEDYRRGADPDKSVFGARYTHPLCKEFPHFEVLILEAGIMRRLGIGVVMESYSKSLMPGWRDGTVGYHIDHGKVFDGSPTGKETKGYAMAFRGDLIRCTVVFKDEKKIEDKEEVRVPVVFTLNDKRITPEGQEGELFTHYNPNGRGLFPYIGMRDKGCSVLVKTRSQREEKHHQCCQEVKQIKECLEENNKTLKALLARLNGTYDTPL